MKKYEKPAVYVENLASSVIATSCNYTAMEGEFDPDDPTIPHYPGQEYGDPPPRPVPLHGAIVLFVTGPCTTPPDNMGIQLCYHGFDPNDQANVFGS